MYIKRMEILDRHMPNEHDRVAIDVTVPLYTIHNDEFYEFLKKFPKIERDEYGDEYKTSISDALTEFILLKTNEDEILDFVVGKGNSKTGYKLVLDDHYFKNVKESRQLVFTFSWFIQSEAPF